MALNNDLNDQIAASVAEQLSGKISCNMPEIPTVSGKSAYDLAIDNGFVGSVEAYLESLKVKGDPGTPGKNGVKGDPGKNGRDGKDATLTDILNIVYPIGFVVEFSIDFDPNLTWIGTTWERFAEGRGTVGVSTQSNAEAWTKSIGNLFGSYTHTLTIAQLPKFTVPIDAAKTDSSGSARPAFDRSTDAPANVNTKEIGSGAPHNIVQPSIVTAKWVRIS